MNFLIRHKFLVALLLIIIVIALRIFYVQLSEREVNGEYPVEKLVLHDRWISVYPSSGASVSDIMTKNLFSDFRPGMTFDDSVLEFGKPNNIRREEKGNTYFEYWTDFGRIEVGREEYSTGDGIGVDWALYSYPKEMHYSDILISSVTKYIDPNRKETGVMIMDQKGEISIFINILGSRVDHLIKH